MKWPYLVVLILVALFCGLIGFILGFFCGMESSERAIGYNVDPDRLGFNSGMTFFAGLSVGMVMFLVLVVGLIWWHYRARLESSLDELSTRVDRLQRTVVEMQQKSTTNVVPIP